jgi:multicomponent Na+:H+ antiporter subunit D
VLASVLVALVFLGGALSFLYAFQVYQRVFLAPDGSGGEPEGKSSPVAARVLVLALAALVVVVGIWPEPLLMLAEGAAAALTRGGPG